MGCLARPECCQAGTLSHYSHTGKGDKVRCRRHINQPKPCVSIWHTCEFCFHGFACLWLSGHLQRFCCNACLPTRQARACSNPYDGAQPC